jgi:hypothetical protein
MGVSGSGEIESRSKRRVNRINILVLKGKRKPLKSF